MCVALLASLFLAVSPHLVEAKNAKIKIGPKACDLNDEPTGQPVKQTSVGKNAKDTVHWDSHKKGRHTYLIFHVPKDCGAPFASLVDLHKQDTQGNELFQLGSVTTDQLDSGAIAEGCRCTCDVEPSQCEVLDPAHPKRWQIKYDQYLENANGQFDHCDGWIIVKP
jgi:hypothetical protein